MSTTSSPLYLGIDTGGTFTDGILLDPQTRQIVRSVKTITTHADLTRCILSALDALLPDDPSTIALVSLSTTLATNAIAEGKRKPVGLLLLGYDAKLIYNYQFHQQFGTPHYYFIPGRHGLDGAQQEPLDEAALTSAIKQSKDNVTAFAVSSYAGPANAAHETRAAEIIAEMSNLPAVLAHHLSNELDSIRRATTASLNASLLSHIQNFLSAVLEMLEKRGVHCPVMIVKGDSSLARAGFAGARPVEFIHSGPATSAIGGQFLSRAEKGLVVDMGGTTTDITLVNDGKVQAYESLATVESYRTCVRTIKARSFGLGGDSMIYFDHWRNLEIGPARLIPLSYLCYTYPQVKQDLLGWLETRNTISYADGIEYWLLRREPDFPIEDEKTRKIVDILRNGPQRYRDISQQVRSIAPFHVAWLVGQEIIDRAGLTPTDLLHVTGEFTPWDTEIAVRATELAARNWNEDILAFAQRIKDTITQRIVAEIVQFLSGKAFSAPPLRLKDTPLDRWLFQESLTPSDPYLGSNISLKIPLVGIGAPARVFLPPVASALNTEIIIPEYHQVANAVGAVVGSVLVQQTGEIFPCVEGASITGYIARVGSVQHKFSQYTEALSYARQALLGLVAEEAKAAGATHTIIDCQETPIWDGMSHIKAWAIGKPTSQ